MSLLNVVVDSGISTIIVDLGIIILLGFIVGRMFEMIKIPAITGYLVAGLLLGPITGYMSVEYLNHFSIIGDVALGFIAFQVGNELWLGKLKKSGKNIVIITIIQAVLTTTIVAVATSFFVDLPIALMLGAVAAATAPAPIMMIIKKYRTKGVLTDTILPVVGLDDAVGVVMFGTLMSISVSMMASDAAAETSLWLMLAEPLFEIGISIAIGAFIGFASGKAIQTMSDNTDRKEKNLNIVIITVLLTTGAAILAGASPILTPMVAGAVVTNLINKECFILEEETIRFFIPPLMIAFFTIAGAQLQFDVILAAGIVGLVYIVGRIIGKFFGAYIGAVITKADPKVRKYLGICLLPQSGVAIGLSVAAYAAFAPVNLEYALIIKNVILASVLFFALTGPILVKIALFKSKENTIPETEGKLSWKNSQILQK